MSTERDELSEVLYVEDNWHKEITEHDLDRRSDDEYRERASRKWREGRAGWSHEQRYPARADAILAAGYRKPQQPRMIESAYEDDGPDSLPPLSVVLSGGKPAIRQYDHTWMDWDGSSWDDWELEYPLTVLHVGGAE